MDDHEVWPLPYTGLPALLNSLSIIMFAMLVVVSMTLRYDLLFILSFLVAVSLSLASLGRRVVVDDGVIILEYGYPKPLLKYRFSLDEIRQAFEAVEKRKVVKAIIIP